MRYAPRVLLAGGLGFAMSFVVACGGSGGLLSSDQASTLNRQLDQISSALSAGQCVAVSGAASAFGNLIADLPASVSPTLTNNLKQGAVTVQQLATRDCHPQRTTSTATNTITTATTTTTHTASTPSTPSQTVTTPPSTTSPATTPSPPGTNSTGGGTGGAGLPGGGSGSGGSGSGNGNGNGR